MKNNFHFKKWVLIVLFGVCSIISFAQTSDTDLTTHEPTVVPSGATFEWREGDMSSSALVSTPTAVQPGLYYGYYNFGAGCFSEGTPISIITNTCPTETVDLNSAVDTPNGTESFHSALPVSDANEITGTAITEASIGATYYVAYKTTVDGSSCYSEARPIVAAATTCAPMAVDDSGIAPFGTTTSIDILGNDDFLANDGNTITAVAGGTATGTIVFDPITGELDYTPTLAETGTNVTVIYEVCDGPECDQATVLITVPADSDADGNPDVTDLDDDNDGILDTDECPTTSLLFDIGWNSNRTDFKSQDGVWQDPSDGTSTFATLTYWEDGNDGVDLSVISGQGGNYVIGSGLTDLGDGSNIVSDFLTAQEIGDVESNLALAKTDGDYIDYPFQTGSFVSAGINNLGTVSWSGYNFSMYAEIYETAAGAGTATVLLPEVLIRDGNQVLNTVFGSSYEYYALPVSYYAVSPNTDYTVRVYYFNPVNSPSPTTLIVDDFQIGFVSCDTDGDGVPNLVDLDSDNDDCPDFVEGGGTFALTDGTTASGTVSSGTGSTVTTNLGTVVNTDPMSASYGVPTVAGAGQSIGTANDDSISACTDTDGDGVTDIDELNPPDGEPATNPNDPCSFIASDVSVAVSGDYLVADCDGDGVTNGDEIDPDGDGTPGGVGPNGPATDPDDPCSLNLADVTLLATSTSDCDGDGVTNADEINGPDGAVGGGDETDPTDPCSLNLGQVTLLATSATDCDGDGVTNADEINGPDGAVGGGDETDPTDPCSLNLGQVTLLATSATDCDGDGVTNADEINGPDGAVGGGDETDPTDPCSLNLGQVTLLATSATDCDGDGVTNADEINGPDGAVGGGDETDPTDPCSLNLGQVTLLATSATDCDGDGVTNADEINGPDGAVGGGDETDPTDPCSLNLGQVTLLATSATDCDGDGVTNADEINGPDGAVGGGDETDPTDPCSLNLGQVTLLATSATDCDGDGVTNADEINGPDGAVGGGDETDPTDPCSLNLGQVTLLATSATDCDGDGVTNADEINGPDGAVGGGDETDPTDPCSLNLGQVTLLATSATDCDGDGVTNADEINGPDGAVGGGDETDPTDPCSLNLGQVTLLATSATDCDGDGVTNADEINGPDGAVGGGDETDPTDPCSLNLGQVTLLATSATDCDGDGVTNADEINGPDGAVGGGDETDPTDPCSLNLGQVTLLATSATDCDGDGVTNADEINGPDGAVGGGDETDPTDPCSLNLGQVTLLATSATDCDGDGVTNADEINGPDGAVGGGDETDPTDPCSLNLGQVTLLATSATDCDGDGVTNADEINGPDGAVGGGDETDPTDPCSLNLGQVTLLATSATDCDGDGVTNADEINGLDDDPLMTGDNTDPNDPCDYNAADQGTPDAAWTAADCDMDGNPNGTDPNPLTPTAVDDAGTAPLGTTTSIDILGNDDFLPNDGNTITPVAGGTAAGTVAFDPVTGELDYTPDASEPGSDVTVIYEVCQGAVCDQATVTITVPPAGDTDGDGDPDNTDPNPNDPCIYGSGQVYANATSAFLDGDCDGDGVTNADEIDPDGDGTPGGTGPNGPATDPQDPCSLNIGDVSVTATSTGDCDGDGVTNADEINGLDDDPLTAGDNTDPNDPCDYNAADQGTPDAAWTAADCDMDGNPNGTDPNPLTPTAVDDTGTAPLGTTTSIDILGNDDFLPNDGNTITPVAGGTAAGTVAFDPVTGELDYTPDASEPGSDVTVIYEVCQGAVCDQATVTITVPPAGDTDGDGDPDNTDPNPNDPCIYGSGQVYANATSAFLDGDCDGDGVTNADEIDPDGDGTPGGTGPNGPATDPQDPCSLNIGDVSVTATSTGDCDGDGVTNADEINGLDDDPLMTGDNTNPNDPCDYNAADQGTPDAAWTAADCDMDGNPNGTDPNPLTPTAVDDAGTAPLGTTTSIDILGNDDFLPNDGNTITPVAGGTAAGTVAFDPVTGELDYTPDASEPGSDVTVIYEVCQGAVCDQATVTITVPPAGDTDGDGDPDNTDPNPNDPCIYSNNQVYANATTAFLDGDCDGDGVTNADEIDPDGDGTPGGTGPNGPATDPQDPCSLNIGDVSVTATSTGDCDGDGVTNADEINGLDDDPLMTGDNTNPNDPCDYNAADQGTPDAAWTAADCDMDGNPNGTDPNPLTPTAVDDAGTAPLGTTTSIDILGNDDFLPNDGNTITPVAGGTAAGTVAFDPVTGELDYTPDASEPGSDVTVIYEVCQGAVCDQATVTITVPPAGDTDGDGDPDNTDPNPNDPCIYSNNQVYANATTAFLDGDCDGDGVTNADEIDPDGDGTPGGTGPNGPATDPQDPCSLNIGDVSVTATSTGDCDGDGVTNADEINGLDDDPLTAGDNTDPNDPCDYNAADQGTPDAAWTAADCDMDGNPNGTDPNPLTPTAVDDTGTAPLGTTTSIDILGNDDFLPNDGNTITPVAGGTAAGTVAFDPVTGELDYTPDASEPGSDVTVIYEVCQGAVCDQATVTITVPPAGDTDGDGDPDNTDPNPNDPCIYGSGQVYANATSAFLDGDCDGDGVTNADEIDPDGDGTPGGTGPNGPATDPQDPCSLNIGDVSVTATSTGDCDGDGVTNADEINGLDDDPLTAGDNTDPNDPCDYNAADQGTPDAAWTAADCDMDGNPNGTDPNPLTPTAVDDTGTAPLGTTTSIDILGNDDFLPNDGNTITPVAGGTAAGTVAFDPVTGELDYTPDASEPGSDVTVIYEVCQGAVCDQATVTITVPPASVTCNIDVAVWIEGAYETAIDEMRTDLNDQQLLPGQDPLFFIGQETPAGQPYSIAPWSYNGTEGDAYDYTSVGNGAANYDADVVDWVLVSLRTTTLASSTICTQAAWLMKDGTVTFPDDCDCTLTSGQEVYIVIEHRNHLPIMTPTAIEVTGAGVGFDFRSQQSFLTFTGDGQKLLEAGTFGMFAANGDQSNALGSRTDVNPTDESIWTGNNSEGDIYIIGDYNLDGDVNANDESLWLDNTGKSSDVNFD